MTGFWSTRNTSLTDIMTQGYISRGAYFAIFFGVKNIPP